MIKHNFHSDDRDCSVRTVLRDHKKKQKNIRKTKIKSARILLVFSGVSSKNALALINYF